jgi:hypothetical protein
VGAVWDEDAREADETRRMSAIPELLMKAELPGWSPISPGLHALEPAVNDELPLKGRACLWCEVPKPMPKKSMASLWRGRDRGSRSGCAKREMSGNRGWREVECVTTEVIVAGPPRSWI